MLFYSNYVRQRDLVGAGAKEFEHDFLVRGKLLRRGRARGRRSRSGQDKEKWSSPKTRVSQLNFIFHIAGDLAFLNALGSESEQPRQLAIKLVIRMSIERLKADKEAARLKGDHKRLTELRQFLSTSNNPRDRARVEEIEEQLQRIEQRLHELDLIT